MRRVREEKLTLALFVAGVFANNAHDTFPADNPAGITEFFNRGSYFHDKMGRWKNGREGWWNRGWAGYGRTEI